MVLNIRSRSCSLSLEISNITRRLRVLAYIGYVRVSSASAHSLLTDTFWCPDSNAQGRLRLLHCSHGTFPEHLIFWRRQRVHLNALVRNCRSSCCYELTYALEVRFRTRPSATVSAMCRDKHSLCLSTAFGWRCRDGRFCFERSQSSGEGALGVWRGSARFSAVSTCQNFDLLHNGKTKSSVRMRAANNCQP